VGDTAGGRHAFEFWRLNDASDVDTKRPDIEECDIVGEDDSDATD
jgi:hypothetical protein